MAIYKNSYPFGNIVRSGLVLNLDATNLASYPGSGSLWYDTSGNGNSGSFVSGAYVQQQRGRNSVYFDGVDDYVSLNSSINPSPNFTVSAWVYPTNLTNILNVIGMTDSVAATSQGWCLRLRGDQPGDYFEYGQFSVGQFSTNISATTSWQSIAITKNGTSITFFVNGQINTTASLASYSAATNNTFIGARNASDTITHYWSGSISAVQIYNRALSLSEVQQNFNALRNRFGI